MRTNGSARGLRPGACALLLVVLAWVPACAKKTANLVTPGTAVSPAAAPAAAPAPVPAPPTASAPPRAAGGGSATAAPRPAPLVGPVTRADLEAYVTWKDLRAQDYTPDAAAVATIGERAAGTTVLVIVATWCADSKRDVPRFFRIADLARFPLERVTLVAVDRTKKDADGLTEKHAVTRVPTFVFFRGDREIGRVTEKPVTTLENDIATILLK